MSTSSYTIAMHYYDVAVGSEKHWDSSVFTYASELELMPLTLVRVPFGRKSKVGYVVQEVKKPAFPCRQLDPYDGVEIPTNTISFMKWYQAYYAAQPGQVHGQFLPHYLTKRLPKLKTLQEKQQYILTLSALQSVAVKEVFSTPKPTVLHGITGSGKTRVYLDLINRCLQDGNHALLLYPEIALTPQIMNDATKLFPVAAFHSSMSNAERSKLWFRVATASTPMLVVGPRSALFLPYQNLGLIVIDEAHESTYKQDSDIHYNGILTAGGLAKAHGAKLVVGSATPPITESELVLQSGGNLVCMHSLAIESETAYKRQVEVIDRKNKQQFKRHHLIADSLIAAIEDSMSRGKQSLLFLNRRGTAKITLCEHCGWQATCPSCDLPMTFHHDLHVLLCHTCGLKSSVTTVCPDCGGNTSLKSYGSKAIVDDIAALMPDARIGRYDSDTHSTESFAATYNDIRAGGVDILIGTQQIAKGLDLPLLETVGVLDADLSLHFPDYSSDERTFQLLAQVCGRVGRGHGNGRVYIQTLQPESSIIEQATREDWHSFQTSELVLRRAHQFPPYRHIAKIIFRAKSLEKAMDAATAAKQTIKSPDIEVDGPLPAFITKRSGAYYVHLHIKSASRGSILSAVRKLRAIDIIVDLDPVSLL